MAETKTQTPEEMLAAVLGKIPGVGGKIITGEEVAFHKGHQIMIPEGMTYGEAFTVLKRLEKQAEEETEFTRMFKFRPDDGGYATSQAIKNRWGIALGKATYSFFGKNPPEMRTINIGVNETMQVPWGHMEVPTLPGLTLFIGEAQDRDFGTIFGLRATGPQKYRDEIEGFFDDVEAYLQSKSIYRGRAIVGSNDPQFLDLSTFRGDQIVFSQDVMAALEGNLWAPIKHTDVMRREGLSLKRANLLYGPFGTGKTSIGQMTAQIATDNGWTFLSARPGRDKIDDVLRTARLYQPAVVFVEDIDTETSSSDADEVTKLLEAFDGITSKGGEIVVAMTTNHIERIHKGMLRPGRLDSIVEIAALDRPGVERLVKVVVSPEKLDTNVDYDKVFEAVEGYLPAFIRETLARAVTYAISRLDGSSHYVIDTDDIVGAAHSLRPQFERLQEAEEGIVPPTLDATIKSAVRDAVTGLSTHDPRGGYYSVITEAQENDYGTRDKA